MIQKSGNNDEKKDNNLDELLTYLDELKIKPKISQCHYHFGQRRIEAEHGIEGEREIEKKRIK